MGNKKETVTLQIPESFTFGNFEAEDFNKVLSFFDWSLKDKKVEIDNKEKLRKKNTVLILYFLYGEFLFSKGCSLLINTSKGFQEATSVPRVFFPENFNKLFDSKNELLKLLDDIFLPVVINNSKDREKALSFVSKFTQTLNIEYEKVVRYIINELLYNSLEHGKNGIDIPSMLQFYWNEEKKQLSFIVADIGVGIRKHLRQTYPNLATDSEAILHSIKPQISGTFGRSNSGYETKNNAGVGLYFSSNIAQRLNADMFIVSGNGFVHISPTEIASKELEHQWKGTFVYVKIKLGLIEDLNLQKMLSEITKSIPRPEKAKDDNNLYISIRNYFGKYAEDKDLAKKIRDKYILPALEENKSLTLDFEEIISAPHSLLNAMLATPIERLGLAAYKKIKIINAAPEIRETLDFIFDDNTSNA